MTRRTKDCGKKPNQSVAAIRSAIGNRKAPAEIGHAAPAFAGRSHEDRAISAQHVNRGDDHAPKREHGRDLKNVKAFQVPRRCETRRRKPSLRRRNWRSPADRWRRRRQAQKRIRRAASLCPRPPRSSKTSVPVRCANFAGDGEEQRDRNSVREHQNGRAVRSEQCCRWRSREKCSPCASRSNSRASNRAASARS